jgi:hypothetical protein
MKRTLLIALCAVAMCGFVRAKAPRHTGSSGRVVHVKQHTTKKGKAVKAHDRTAPNRSQKDNWSTKGNVNPETGKAGTRKATY